MVLGRAILVLCLSGSISTIAHAESLPSSCSNALESTTLSTIVKKCSQAANKGNAEAAYRIGEAYDFSPASDDNYNKALHWYNQAAQQGHILAQRNLAALYDGGHGKPRDTFKAFHWYQKAAKQGQPHSQLMTGMMYLYGSGTPQDSGQAKYWFEQAALSGEPNGQYMYGKIIYPQEPQQALQWFQRAAAQNNGYALYQLGLLHYLGEHSLESDETAILMAQKSMQAGHKKAKLLKEKLIAKQRNHASNVDKGTSEQFSDQPLIDKQQSKPPVLASIPEPTKMHSQKSSTATLTSSKLAENTNKDVQWLIAQPEENYSIQLALMSNPTSISRFARFYPTVDDTHHYASQFPNGTLYILLKGSYPTFTEAKIAMDALPDKVKKTKPWIRQFKKLQTQYINPNNP